MTLYLKYRPQKIADLDITSVRNRLTELVLSVQMPQAFLFSGSKGTGKTSSARILAKAINCEKTGGQGEPCNECDTCRAITAGNHIDVIEMDAASNRGIDDVRALREQVHLGPVAARKKVYIIDEAHMLTTEAANALLKTLEEPPAHAVFILATTDPQKLPTTVISRLTAIDFPRATIEEIVKKLTFIAKQEKIEVTNEVLTSIARSADGAFRDAVKTLEQLAREGGLGETDSHFLWATAPARIVDYVSKGETNQALSLIQELGKQGASLKLVMNQTVKHIHELLLGKFALTDAKTDMSTDSLVLLLDTIIEATRKVMYADPSIVFSAAIITFSGKRAAPTSEKMKQEQGTTTSVGPKATPKPATETTGKPEVQKKNTDTVVLTDSHVTTEAWTKLLAAIKLRNASIEALLHAAHPIKMDADTLAIGVYYRFHKERLEVGPHRIACEEAAESVFGHSVRVLYELTDRPITEPTVPSEPSLTPVAAPDIISAAAEIFSV